MTRRFGRSYKPHPAFGFTSRRENESDYTLTTEYWNLIDKGFELETGWSFAFAEVEFLKLFKYGVRVQRGLEKPNID